MIMTATELVLREQVRKLENELLFYRRSSIAPFNGNPLEIDSNVLHQTIQVPLYTSIKIDTTNVLPIKVIVKTADGIGFYIEYNKFLLSMSDKTQIFDSLIQHLTRKFVRSLIDNSR